MNSGDFPLSAAIQRAIAAEKKVDDLVWCLTEASEANQDLRIDRDRLLCCLVKAERMLRECTADPMDMRNLPDSTFGENMREIRTAIARVRMSPGPVTGRNPYDHRNRRDPMGPAGLD